VKGPGAYCDAGRLGPQRGFPRGVYRLAKVGDAARGKTWFIKSAVMFKVREAGSIKRQRCHDTAFWEGTAGKEFRGKKAKILREPKKN